MVQWQYSREQFLKYYEFEDEPEMVPRIFYRRYKFYENILKNVKDDVKTGVKLIDAIRLNAGVATKTVYEWRAAFIKELEDGKTDTPLIRVFSTGLRSDANLYRKVMGLVMQKAEEGDTTAAIYLAKHRLGYNSTKKQEVEISSKDEAPIQFVFADMTPTENEEKDE